MKLEPNLESKEKNKIKSNNQREDRSMHKFILVHPTTWAMFSPLK